MKLIKLKTKNSEPLSEQFVARFEHDIGLNATFNMTEHFCFSCVRTDNLYNELF